MRVVALGVLLSFQALICHADDAAFINFAIKQAHDKKFMGCDAAIRSAFQYAEGGDINVNASWFDATLNDSLTLTSTWGNKGDSVLMIANFRKQAGKCYLSRTVVLTTTNSCTVHANESKQYAFRNETGDYTWFENKGGSQMLLKPLNNGCIATYATSSVF